LLARPDSLLVVGDKTDTNDYDYADDVEFFAYDLTVGIEHTVSVFRTDGKAAVTLKVTRHGGSLRCFSFVPKTSNGSFEFACEAASEVAYASPVRI